MDKGDSLIYISCIALLVVWCIAILGLTYIFL